MPYSSQAQRGFFHTDTARKKGISKAVVQDFDEASKGLKLPKHSKKHKAIIDGMHRINKEKK